MFNLELVKEGVAPGVAGGLLGNNSIWIYGMGQMVSMQDSPEKVEKSIEEVTKHINILKTQYLADISKYSTILRKEEPTEEEKRVMAGLKQKYGKYLAEGDTKEEASRKAFEEQEQEERAIRKFREGTLKGSTMVNQESLDKPKDGMDPKRPSYEKFMEANREQIIKLYSLNEAYKQAEGFSYEASYGFTEAEINSYLQDKHQSSSESNPKVSISFKGLVADNMARNLLKFDESAPWVMNGIKRFLDLGVGFIKDIDMLAYEGLNARTSGYDWLMNKEPNANTERKQLSHEVLKELGGITKFVGKALLNSAAIAEEGKHAVDRALGVPGARPPVELPSTILSREVRGYISSKLEEMKEPIAAFMADLTPAQRKVFVEGPLKALPRVFDVIDVATLAMGGGKLATSGAKLLIEEIKHSIERQSLNKLVKNTADNLADLAKAGTKRTAAIFKDAADNIKHLSHPQMCYVTPEGISVELMDDISRVVPEGGNNLLSVVTTDKPLSITGGAIRSKGSFSTPKNIVNKITKDLHLDHHEGGIHGGHTKDRHIDKPKEWLKNRLDNNPRIIGSTSFPDIDTANKYTRATLERNADSIAEWLGDTLSNKRGFTAEFSETVGYGFNKAGQYSSAIKKVEVRLMRNENGFSVVTSYPLIDKVK